MQFIKPEHFKDLEFSNKEQEQLIAIADRIQRLHNLGILGTAANAVLKELGRLNRPYLNPEEAFLLSALEQFYKVEQPNFSNLL